MEGRNGEAYMMSHTRGGKGTIEKNGKFLGKGRKMGKGKMGKGRGGKMGKKR